MEALVLMHAPGFQNAVGKDVLSWTKRVRVGFRVTLGKSLVLDGQRLYGLDVREGSMRKSPPAESEFMSSFLPLVNQLAFAETALCEGQSGLNIGNFL